MYRKGKYTRRRGLVASTKYFVKRRLAWWKALPLWKKIVYPLIPIVIIAVVIPFLTYLYFARDISDIDRLLNRNNTGVVLTDIHGKVIYETPGARVGHRDMVPLDKISDNMEKALVASEDKDFYKHGGFSIASTLRAVYGYIIHRGGGFGGSTITQQLAKITLLSQQRSFLRQYQAFSMAVAIESHYSKDQILDMYLNSVYFGENAFGIEDAAKVYFNKTPAQLSLAESAMLVGLLPAPSAYSPISGNATYAKERQQYVLDQMVKTGAITQAERDTAMKAKLTYAKPHSGISSVAPHFTEMVLNDLYNKYGQETVLRSGYQVKTTLDFGLQTAANQAVDDNMAHIQANGGSNAGLIAIDPTSGGIRALVGSADYDNKTWGNVNMATTARQPGSSFKPIYYSDALARGVITPTTVLDDTRQDFGGGYSPQDADRNTRGNVTVRQALNWSLNIPSVEVMQKETIQNATQSAKSLGITTLKDDSNYGLALALGVAEVPLSEMTNAYAAFANGGEQYATNSIESIADKYGSTIFTAKHEAHRAISQQGAYLISNILSDNQTRSRMFGSSLNVTGTDGLTKTAAVKTGTTEDSRDAWTIGYTPQIAIGVWVGNNDNTPMGSGGADMAGPIWQEAMRAAIGTASPSFTRPSGIVEQTVCTTVGRLSDVFLSTNVPSGCQAPDTKKNTTEKPKNDDTAKCTVAGKEDLLASDPNCTEEMCTVPGKENLAANDPNCTDDTTDTDSDGVPDITDQCPATPPGAPVNAIGCAAGQTPTGGGPNPGGGTSP